MRAETASGCSLMHNLSRSFTKESQGPCSMAFTLKFDNFLPPVLKNFYVLLLSKDQLAKILAKSLDDWTNKRTEKFQKRVPCVCSLKQKGKFYIKLRFSRKINLILIYFMLNERKKSRIISKICWQYFLRNEFDCHFRQKQLEDI